MILDQYGKEIKANHSKSIIDYIKAHPSVVIAVISFVGAIISVLIRFITFLHKKGWAMYFRVPDEYILIGNSISIYSVIVTGVISLAYIGAAILTVRMWLRKDNLLKRIGCTFLVPMLFIFIYLVISIGNPMFILKMSRSEWVYVLRNIIIMVLLIHIPFVFGMGYCMALPLHKDIIQRRGNTNRKRKKYKKSKTNKKYKNEKDRLILGLTWIAFVMAIYFIYTIFAGHKQASDEKKFKVTYIDEKLYVSVMSDGNNLILKRGAFKNKTLIIYGDECMKVNSDGYLLKEITYDKVKVR